MSFKTTKSLLASLVLASPVVFHSCINKDYDLTKDFDNTITIDGDISAPIGNSETIVASDLLDIEEDGLDILSVDSDGNYSLSIQGRDVEGVFVIPSSSFPGATFHGDFINVGNYPDFISRDGAVLDLYNPQVLISVYNESPLPMTLNADIVSRKGENTCTVHLGDNGSATVPIVLEASGTTKICFSRTGEGAPAGYKSVKSAGLSEILRILPEQICLTNIEIKADSKDIPEGHDKTYSFHCGYDILVPLAFGSDLRFEYSYDFIGWNETFNPDSGDGFDVKNADVMFDFVNMIPVGMDVTASAIDASGNAIPGITIQTKGTILSGSTGNPSRNPMTLNLKSSAQDMRNLDGIRLDIKALGPDKEHLGVCLNKNQGIRLENMKIRLQGSITTEL